MKFEEFQAYLNGPLTPAGARALERAKLRTGKTWKEFAEPFGLAGTTLNNLINHHAGTERPIKASHLTAQKLWNVVRESEGDTTSLPPPPPRPARELSAPPPPRRDDLSLEDLARIALEKGFRVTFEQITRK